MNITLEAFKVANIPVKWVPAHPDNFERGRKGQTVNSIVCHIMGGTLVGTDATFQTKRNSASSTTYGIGRKWEDRNNIAAPFEIHQYVLESDTAFHCGINQTAIIQRKEKPPVWPLFQANDLRPGANSKAPGYRPALNPNLHTIGIEMEGNPLTVWTDQHYRPLVVLIRDIAARWKIPMEQPYIVGHCDINPTHRPNCPGKLDMRRLIKLLKDPTYGK